MQRTGLFLTLIFILASACTPLASDSGTSATVILASTTFLADIAQNVLGDRFHVDAIFPIGVDPHAFQPAPQDSVKVGEADLLIFIGAGYETFERILLENSGNKGMVIEASTGLKSRTEALDPHFWLDPNNVIIYVENVREGLTRFDPDGAAIYKSNAAAYTAKLKELNLWIEQQVMQIPLERRLLITNHESLGYFADHYGFTVVGAVIPSLSSDAAPSARDMAALIDRIKSTSAPAVFLDASDNPALAAQISQETGVKVVDDLHLESLTTGPPAATYIDMMKHNVTRIVEALE